LKEVREFPRELHPSERMTLLFGLTSSEAKALLSPKWRPYVDSLKCYKTTVHELMKVRNRLLSCMEQLESNFKAIHGTVYVSPVIKKVYCALARFP